VTARLNAYISYNGNAREALEFYQQVFGGELTLSTFGDFGQPEAGSDKIMHGMLVTEDGMALMAADTPPGMDLTPGTTIAMSLSGDDGERLRGYWDKLSSDGTVNVPLDKQMWGDEFGMCVDRFGIQWMVNISAS
jgi:PhnB protein